MRFTVVGSGASGVHFALSLLERGHAVTMVDVGRTAPPHVRPDLSFRGLKSELDDPAEYFLGNDYASVTTPGSDGEYYGFPPNKLYIFEEPPFRSSGFAPLLSFARGGLAEAWTAGCYPFNDDDLNGFPFKYSELAPFYGLVAGRIGVTGEEDDLSRFLPLHDNLIEPLRLDEHSRLLLDTYARKRRELNERLGCYIGRTRVATLTHARDERGACEYLGRCLWGCPKGALYTPSMTLAECMKYPGFTYRSGLAAQFFRTDASGRITSLVCTPVQGGPAEELPVEGLALGAGALASTHIFLRSVRAARGAAPPLDGLMDNRQILVPFVNLRMIGRPWDDRTYQYHLLGLGLEPENGGGYVHGQITTLKSSLVHPIVQKLPFDLVTSARVTRALHAALGIVNVNLHDWRRDDNRVELSATDERLSITYAPPPGEERAIAATLGRVRRVLRRLGCIVPPGMAHVRPMGASVHYAGTLPMSETPRPWATDPGGRSYDFSNLWVVDGATFPRLPAKNLTFTLMANAARIAAGI